MESRKYVVIFIIMISVILSNEEFDVQKFLENIKRTILEAIRKTQRRKKTRNAEYAIRKLRIRKSLLEKLSNPLTLFRKPEHYIIEVGNKKHGVGSKGVVNKENNNVAVASADRESDNKTIVQTMNRVLRSNPFLNISRMSKSELLKMRNTIDKTSVDIDDEKVNLPRRKIIYDQLLRTYYEIIQIPIKFWTVVEYVFIKNDSGFQYFVTNACPYFHRNAIIPVSTDVIIKEKQIWELGYYPLNEEIFKSVNLDLTAEDCLKLQHHRVNRTSNLCFDFAKLHCMGLYITKVIPKPKCMNEKLDECFTGNNIKNIYEYINTIYYYTKKYMSIANYLLVNKIVPISIKLLKESIWTYNSF